MRRIRNKALSITHQPVHFGGLLIDGIDQWPHFTRHMRHINGSQISAAAIEHIVAQTPQRAQSSHQAQPYQRTCAHNQQ